MELLYLTKWFQVIKEKNQIIVKPIENTLRILIPFEQYDVNLRGNGVDVLVKNKGYELYLRFFNLPIWVFEFKGNIKEIDFSSPIITLQVLDSLKIIDCRLRKEYSVTKIGEFLDKLHVGNVYTFVTNKLGISLKIENIQNIENVYLRLRHGYQKNLTLLEFFLESSGVGFCQFYMCLGNDLENLCKFIPSKDIQRVVIDSRKIFFKVVEILNEPFFIINTLSKVRCKFGTLIKIPVEIWNKGVQDGECILYVRDELGNLFYADKFFIEHDSKKLIYVTVPCLGNEIVFYVQNLKSKNVDDEKKLKLVKEYSYSKFTIVDVYPKKVSEVVGKEFNVNVKVMNIGSGKGKVIVELWSSKTRHDVKEIDVLPNEVKEVKLCGVVEKSGLSTYRIVLYNVEAKKKDFEDFIYVEGVEQFEKPEVIGGITAAVTGLGILLTYLFTTKEGSEISANIVKILKNLFKIS